MKKLGALTLVLLIVTGALAADDGLAISGEAKTTLQVYTEGDADTVVKFDNDGNPGRAQFGFVYTAGNLEAKWMLRSVNLSDAGADALIPYAFGTAAFLDDQIGISVGRIDGALWASGGVTDISFDGILGARFEFKPAVVEGLSVGFTLPAFNFDNKVGDYFSELIFGVRYNLADTLDIRVAVNLDGDGDIGANGSQKGTSFLYGLGLPVLGTFVPGLSLWVDGAFRGLGGDPYEFYTLGAGTIGDAGYTTKNGLKIGFDNEGFSAYAKFAFETWKDQGTVFGILPGASYQLLPWLKPGVEAEFYIRSYEDDFKTAYKLLYPDESPAGFDRLYFKVYAEMGLGNGFTLTPSFALTSHTKYGTFGKANPGVAPSADGRVDTTVGISLAYSF
jgi:hypothetical protein